MEDLKDLMKTNYLLENNFFSSTKKGKIHNDGKISDGHIGVKDYMTCENI